MKTTILASALLSVLTIPYSAGGIIRRESLTPCGDILTKCSFSGTCCSVSDYNDGKGCSLTVKGGVCSISGGSDCIWSGNMNATSSDVCPVGDYDAFAEYEPPTTSAGVNFGTHGFQYAAAFLVTSILFVNQSI